MLDAHSRQILNEDQAVEMLYADPEMEIANALFRILVIMSWAGS